MKAALIIIRDAAIATVVFGLIGVGANALRTDGIPLVAEDEYDIYVPCPEPLGEAFPIEPDDERVTDERTLLIDGRTKDEYDEWHMDSAVHVEFDYLTPIPDEQIRELLRTKAGMVVVYGDGDPKWDSGYETGRELSGRGMNNVHYVVGGAPALMERYK